MSDMRTLSKLIWGGGGGRGTLRTHEGAHKKVVFIQLLQLNVRGFSEGLQYILF